VVEVAQPTPRTLLEALVRQRRWSHQDFCNAYAAASAEIGLSLTISPQHVGRWFGGKLKGLPYPAQCRVLEHMFGVDVTRLFGSPDADRPGTALARSGPSGNGPEEYDPAEEISMAADESARFAQFAEQTNIGPHTLEQFAADIRRIVTVYPNRPVYPIFVEVRALRNRAFEKIEGRQFPDQTRDLYLATGLLCGILANASFDLGRLDAAETQARTAFLCAELAGSNWLRAWVRGTQSLIAYWDDRPRAAAELAASGRSYAAETGTAMVRLAAIEARAYGRMRDASGLDTALGLAADARDDVTGEDDPGGMMTFPEAKQSFYAATARLWLGGVEAAAQADRDAEYAVGAYEQDPPEQRRLGELNLARLDLAAARLAIGQIEGTAEQVRTVLEVCARRPTDSVTRRLRQVSAVLDQPRYRNNQIAGDLVDEISAFVNRAPVPALPRTQQQ